MTSKTEMELTAYCGLYCGDYPHYRSRAAELLDDFRARDFGSYAEAKSRSANAILELADFEQFCSGCSQFPCRIIECCQEKGYQSCWECRDYKGCKRFTSLKPFHGENRTRNLEEIVKYGPDKWAEHRHPFFIWGKRWLQVEK